MTQDDKQLLLKDLCARLPYGVNLHIEFYNLQGDGELASRDVKLTIGNICYCFDNSHWVNFKPYLRPMSSMTEEEYEDLSNFSELDCGYNLVKTNFFETEGVWSGSFFLSSLINWFNEHHFDYRGLIEKGLALEAPKNMYYG